MSINYRLNIRITVIKTQPHIKLGLVWPELIYCWGLNNHIIPSESGYTNGAQSTRYVLVAHGLEHVT